MGFRFPFPSFQDKVGSWYSNPSTGTRESGAAGGGVGKYLKARNAQAGSTAADNNLQETAAVKKRKLGVSGGFNDFSNW